MSLSSVSVLSFILWLCVLRFVVFLWGYSQSIVNIVFFSIVIFRSRIFTWLFYKVAMSIFIASSSMSSFYNFVFIVSNNLRCFYSLNLIIPIIVTCRSFSLVCCFCWFLLAWSFLLVCLVNFDHVPHITLKLLFVEIIWRKWWHFLSYVYLCRCLGWCLQFSITLI